MEQAISKKETTQTAVNFLINYMCANFHLTDESLQKFEQALQMEKEQIINELPTDQEIDDYVDNLKGWVLIEKDFFRSGAKFMRNIIKNNDAKEMRNL